MEGLGGPRFTLVVPNEFVSLAELCELAESWLPYAACE